jgi:pantoate--beta-alanine ligase
LQASLIEFEAGVRDRKTLIGAAESVIRSEPRVQLQYLSLTDPFYLQEVETVEKSGGILSGALTVGKTRIIDNLLLGMDTNTL